jgi:hypothetical protein
MNNKDPNSAQKAPEHDRRKPNRTRDDADWESKVLGRVSSHLRDIPADDADHPSLGWETTVLDTLRRRIERESK